MYHYGHFFILLDLCITLCNTICSEGNEMNKLRWENLHPQVNQINWDHIVVSISGGKDSAVLLDYATKHFPKSIITCVHAIIDIDWEETLPTVKSQAALYEIPLITVQAVNIRGETNGFLKQLTSPRVNRKTKEVGEYKFPGPNNTRWCTSSLKIGPIDKYVRSLPGKTLVMIGERREESPQREKLTAFRPDSKNSKRGRYVVKYSPLLDYKIDEIWDIIHANDIPIHPCYSWGVSRASCAICIFSSDNEIRIAHKKAPHIVKKYIAAEKAIKHSFRYKPATKKRGPIKKTIEDIINEAS